MTTECKLPREQTASFFDSDIVTDIVSRSKTRLTARFDDPKIRPTAIVETGVRSTCEDTHLCSNYEDGLIMAVFDGHGGSLISQFCSENLIRTLDKFRDLVWDERLDRTIVDLQEQIEKSGSRSSIRQGTTAIIAFISSVFEVTLVCLGDARAVIVDTLRGEVMTADLAEQIVVRDMMEDEFSRNGIVDKTVRENRFVTRSHTYDPDNRESEYYTRVHGYKFKALEGSTQRLLITPFVYIEPLRVLGDIYAPNLIRRPEVYVWKLTQSQIRRGNLVLMSDGLENHRCFSVDKLARMMVESPLSVDPSMLLAGTYILERGLVGPEDFIQGDTVGTLRNVVDKMKVVLDGDTRWIEVLDDSFDRFLRLHLSEPGQDTDILRLIALLAILLGSDDNITILATSLVDFAV